MFFFQLEIQRTTSEVYLLILLLSIVMWASIMMIRYILLVHLFWGGFALDSHQWILTFPPCVRVHYRTSIFALSSSVALVRIYDFPLDCVNLLFFPYFCLFLNRLPSSHLRSPRFAESLHVFLALVQTSVPSVIDNG